jgi:hypothetical protein
MQVTIEKVEQKGTNSVPSNGNVEDLSELQLALVGGGSVTVIFG